MLIYKIYEMSYTIHIYVRKLISVKRHKTINVKDRIKPTISLPKSHPPPDVSVLHTLI